MPELNAIGIVASDMATSIRFYRLLGLDMPETPGEGHVEASLPSGLRLMLDAEEVVLSFRPDWSRTTGNQVSLAWGQRYAQLLDPDGVPVDLYAALETA